MNILQDRRSELLLRKHYTQAADGDLGTDPFPLPSRSPCLEPAWGQPML